MKDDSISRQAAIDILSLGKEILSRVLDDMDVVGTDREKYSWGLGLIESNISDIKELPSVQPQPVVRCKDCKHWRDSDGVYRRGVDAESKCPLNIQEVYAGTFYCGYAERRTDE